MTEWTATPEAMLDRVWSELGRGADGARVAANRPTLATIGADGAPQSRIVVLRGADRDACLLSIYTDARSAKVGEIARDPRVALHVWEPEARLQVRLTGEATLHRGDTVAHAAWSALPEEARSDYILATAPGAIIDRPEDAREDPALSARHFTVIRIGIMACDALYLSRTRHRRSLHRRTASGWVSSWCTP